MAEKYCIKCKQNKPFSEFHRLTKSKDGLQTYCKQCNIANAMGYFDPIKMAKKLARANKQPK